jgi:hypothetical protein
MVDRLKQNNNFQGPTLKLFLLVLLAQANIAPSLLQIFQSGQSGTGRDEQAG